MGEGSINDSALPATMHVDWVRVYQTPEDFGEGPESVYLGNAVGGGSRQGVLLWGDEFNGTEVIQNVWAYWIFFFLKKKMNRFPFFLLFSHFFLAFFSPFVVLPAYLCSVVCSGFGGE